VVLYFWLSHQNLVLPSGSFLLAFPSKPCTPKWFFPSGFPIKTLNSQVVISFWLSHQNLALIQFFLNIYVEV
jgi:hypothetical protein